MSKRVSVTHKELSPRIVGSRAVYRPARIQRVEVRGNFPTRDIQEHGNNELAGIVYDIPDYTVTMSAMDTSIKLFSALTGTDPDNYPAEGVSINSLGFFDIVLDVKSATVMDYVKAVFIRKAQLQSMRLAYTVEGDATEEYTFGASTRQYFSHDVVVDVLSGASSPQTLSETPEVLKSGNKAISVMMDGTHLTEVSDTPSTGEYSITGTSISFGDTGTNLVVSYHASPAGNSWAWVSDTTVPAAISGKNIPIKINTNTILRVQSVNINVNLRSNPVKEMGNSSIVGYTYQVPEVTGDITVLDTDLELVALMSTGDAASTDTEFRSCEYLKGYALDLYVELQDPSEPCSTSGTVLKTVKVPDLRLTGESKTSNVGDNVTYTLNFRSADGNLYVYSGAVA